MSKTIAQAAAERILTQQGVHEIGTSNWGPLVSKYIEAAGLNTPVPWCECLVEWGYKPWVHELGGYGSVRRLWQTHPEWEVKAPAPYVLAAYDFGALTAPFDHVDVVLNARKVGPYYRLVTVGGNTSGAAGGSEYDGGAVIEKPRWVRCDKVRFLHVPGVVREPRRHPVPKPKPPRWYADALKAAPLWAWIAWRDNGAPKTMRPPQVPKRIPAGWWIRYRRHKGRR